VGLAVDEYGRLLISSENSNEIYMVRRVFNANSAKMLTDIANQKEEAKEAADELKQQAMEEEGEEEEGPLVKSAQGNGALPAWAKFSVE
jgi:hypothetical protein